MDALGASHRVLMYAPGASHRENYFLKDGRAGPGAGRRRPARVSFHGVTGIMVPAGVLCCIYFTTLEHILTARLCLQGSVCFQENESFWVQNPDLKKSNSTMRTWRVFQGR